MDPFSRAAVGMEGRSGIANYTHYDLEQLRRRRGQIQGNIYRSDGGILCGNWRFTRELTLSRATEGKGPYTSPHLDIRTMLRDVDRNSIRYLLILGMEKRTLRLSDKR